MLGNKGAQNVNDDDDNYDTADDEDDGCYDDKNNDDCDAASVAYLYIYMSIPYVFSYVKLVVANAGADAVEATWGTRWERGNSCATICK